MRYQNIYCIYSCFILICFNFAYFSFCPGRVHTKDRETEKDDNSSDSVLLISDTDKEPGRNSVQASPVKSVVQDSEIITISSVSDSSPVKLNKTPGAIFIKQLKSKF